MPLPKLLHAVSQLGGRLCNRNGQIVVENVPGNLPPGVAAAIARHGDTLCSLMPVAQADVISDDEFLAELRAIGNAKADADAWPGIGQTA